MASRAINDKQITASSESDGGHAAHQGRLKSSASAWSAGNNNHNQWLQIDLFTLYRVTGVATQGGGDSDKWVTQYQLQYSNNDTAVEFQFYNNTNKVA